MMDEHFYHPGLHELRLGFCSSSCQDRGMAHWHEECDCGVEYVLAKANGANDWEIEVIRLVDHVF